MLRKTSILTLAMGGVCCFGVSKASAADSFLPGNVWPNPALNVLAAPGVDQVYSYYNGTYSTGGPYVPNATGDTNPRPNGWHRGNSDFGVTTTPSFCFYNTPGPSGGIAGEGNAPPGNSDGYALEVSDSSQSGDGEWFSDWNAMPVAAGTPFTIQFYYQITGVTSTTKPPSADQFRVSADFADSVGNDTLTAPNQINYQPGLTSADFLIPGGSPDVTSWQVVDETIIAPAGAQSLRITVDSGGTPAATGNIWVSDISVSAVVPEPTSVGLLSVGALLLAKRRRRA
jgi:hypothetical protein